MTSAQTRHWVAKRGSSSSQTEAFRLTIGTSRDSGTILPGQQAAQEAKAQNSWVDNAQHRGERDVLQRC